MNFDPKEYAPVDERIAAFWQKYPGGRINTYMVHLDSETVETQRLVVVKAEVYKDAIDATPVSTGFAKERDGGLGASKTSFIENAETSAIGRALANLGFAVKKRPSAEEMQAAKEREEQHLDALQSLKKLAKENPDAKAEIAPEWERIKDDPTASIALFTKLSRKYAKAPTTI